MSELIVELTNKLLNELINKLSSELIDELTNKLVNELTSELINELTNKLLNELTNELTSELIDVTRKKGEPGKNGRIVKTGIQPSVQVLGHLGYLTICRTLSQESWCYNVGAGDLEIPEDGLEAANIPSLYPKSMLSH